MECLLPSDAFVKDDNEDNDGSDSTRCVRSRELNLNDGSICESTTPISNTNINNKSKLTNNTDLTDDVDTNDNIDMVCKSPMMSSVNRLRRLERDLNSFALDESISNVMIDGDIEFLNQTNNTNNTKLDLKTDNNDNFKLYNDDNIDMSCKSPILYTPIKCNNRSDLNLDINNVYTRFDEPHVNISDDETKNPILSRSVRRNCNNSNRNINNADVVRSELILGNSRCWTDRYDNNTGDIFDDSESLTMSPIRSLTSMLSSSQQDMDLSSIKRNYDYDDKQYSLNVTPTRSFIRSIDKYNNYNKSKLDNKTYNIDNTKLNNDNNKSNKKSDKSLLNDKSVLFVRLDMFDDMSVKDMLCNDYNVMYNVMLSRDEMCRCRLSSDLEMLYKHFKNLCTILKRGGIRNDLPYFRIIQMLVQRMSRRSFSMEQLKQMLWLAPNLINVRWVLINDNVRKKYAGEYKDSSDKIYDLSIRLYKPNNNTNNNNSSNNTNINNNVEYCSTTQDYENVCYRFKNILCCWSLKCESDGCVGVEIPHAVIPENKLRSNMCTPRRDSASNLYKLNETPTRSIVRTGMYNYLNTTPVKSYNKYNTYNDDVSTRSYTRSFDKYNDYNNKLTYNKSKLDNNNLNNDFKLDNNSYNTNNDDEILMSSSKRMKINDVSMSPMSQELLNTPGMQRIRENARRLSVQNKLNDDVGRDLKYWIDMRWFSKMLLELTRDTNSFKLDYIVDFVSKYGSRKVTQDQINKWIDSLSDIDPSVLEKSISKFEDYSTIVTFNKSSSLNYAIDHINQQIKTLQSV